VLAGSCGILPSAHQELLQSCSTSSGNPLCNKRCRPVACKCPREDHGVPWVCPELLLCGYEALSAISLQVKGAEGSIAGELKNKFCKNCIGR